MPIKLARIPVLRRIIASSCSWYAEMTDVYVVDQDACGLKSRTQVLAGSPPPNFFSPSLHQSEAGFLPDMKGSPLERLTEI